MVKTWSSAWFGEGGHRVLYILPDRLTEELLPLRLEPKPNSVVRVLVGRHDILTPDREKQIDSWVAEAKRPTKEPDAQQRIAWAELNKLGRYHGAAWRAAETRLKAGGDTFLQGPRTTCRNRKRTRRNECPSLTLPALTDSPVLRKIEVAGRRAGQVRPGGALPGQTGRQTRDERRGVAGEQGRPFNLPVGVSRHPPP